MKEKVFFKFEGLPSGSAIDLKRDFSRQGGLPLGELSLKVKL